MRTLGLYGGMRYSYQNVTPGGWLFVEDSIATRLRPITRVKVKERPVTKDLDFVGQEGLLLGFSKERGYAIVSIDGRETLLHPESLESADA